MHVYSSDEPMPVSTIYVLATEGHFSGALHTLGLAHYARQVSHPTCLFSIAVLSRNRGEVHARLCNGRQLRA